MRSSYTVVAVWVVVIQRHKGPVTVDKRPVSSSWQPNKTTADPKPPKISIFWPTHTHTLTHSHTRWRNKLHQVWKIDIRSSPPIALFSSKPNSKWFHDINYYLFMILFLVFYGFLFIILFIIYLIFFIIIDLLFNVWFTYLLITFNWLFIHYFISIISWIFVHYFIIYYFIFIIYHLFYYLLLLIYHLIYDLHIY